MGNPSGGDGEPLGWTALSCDSTISHNANFCKHLLIEGDRAEVVVAASLV